MKIQKSVFALLVLLFSRHVYGQDFLIKGKVSDAETKEGIPFANVFLKGSTKGTTTDLDGNYILQTTHTADSLVASYIGYQSKSIALTKGKSNQTIDFELNSTALSLNEVVVTRKGYENPAWDVIENVLKHRNENDLNKLKAFQFQSYTRNEIYVNNLTDKLRNNRTIKQMIEVAEHHTGTDSATSLPLFISESVSDMYFINNPKKRTEHVQKTRMSGLGVEDGSVLSQLTGAAFQDYNFYDNWVSILQKGFISPIASGWKGFYEYELELQMHDLDGIPCYKITFEPKRKEDLAFTGTMWITDEAHGYALKKIDAKVSESANINFVEGIEIQQELIQPEKGSAWLPKNTRIKIQAKNLNDRWGGLLVDTKVANQNFIVNQEKPSTFYLQDIIIEKDANDPAEETYWSSSRPDPLTEEEQQVINTVESIKTLPRVKNLVNVLDIAFNGYINVGKIDLGTYTHVYANNDIEKHRFRLGATTNVDFSTKYVLAGYLGYGTGDNKLKYNMTFRYIANRIKWTQFGFMHQYDLQRVGIFDDDLNQDPAFMAATRWGEQTQAYYNELSRFWFQTDLTKGVTAKVTLRRSSFDPAFDFEYSLDPEKPELSGSNYVNAEVVGELKIAPGHKMFYTEYNTRAVFTTDDRPALTLRYSYGIPNLLGSQFEYQKFYAGIDHSFRMGRFGKTSYQLSGTYIPDVLPYPMLGVHLGNELPVFYNAYAFNLMNFMEFVSDQYASLNLEHHFEGLIANRIPILNKLNVRLFATSRILYGSLSDENKAAILSDIPEDHLKSLNGEPYAEVGYGMENIFKIIRVDFVHRLTHTDGHAPEFAIKISGQLSL
ncbi:DUF5686 family protein [Limibacter armeniacum]|uniref:DUF5686 and carboxypeptidase-like regulatory domain-containing protein n=1 Tax=Limibacter armeniacum TaxID=466084 RepID=UPI002FE557F7